MKKKSIIAILSAVVLMVVASLTLVFTVGHMASADSEVIETVPVDYLNITNGVLGDGTDGGAFTADGKTWIQNRAKYRVEIPAGVTGIGQCAFHTCRGLESITFAENSQLTSIGVQAFAYCSGLTSITIPNSVISIGFGAFSGCSGLTGSITIPAEVTSIGARAFENCSGLTSVTFAENSQLTSVGGYAFEYCRGLTSITIPSSVTSIGTRAFENCSGLTSVTFAENSQLTSVGEYAFYKCSCLNEIIVRNPDLMTNTNLKSYASKLHYGAEQNTVTFNINGGTATLQTIDFGECATEPTIVGYHVSGWYLDEQYTKPFTFDTPIKYDITLYAKWNINRYMVDFNGQGAPVDSVFVNHGDLVAEPTISRTGYTLLGWFVDDEIDQKFNFNTPITDNIGLWAKWSINQYNVIFDSDGGNAVAPQRNVEYNTLLTVPETPTREGYNFLGWYNGDEAYDFATPVSQDMTLTARWESNQPDEPETPDEETSTEVNNKNNNGLLWGILGTSGGILLVGGIVFGIVIAKRRRK